MGTSVNELRASDVLEEGLRCLDGVHQTQLAIDIDRGGFRSVDDHEVPVHDKPVDGVARACGRRVVHEGGVLGLRLRLEVAAVAAGREAAKPGSAATCAKGAVVGTGD